MKVAIIGAGNVGAQAAQRIVEADLADVVLLDIVQGKAEGLALDLSSASSIVHHHHSIMGTSDYKDVAGADIVVITAGRPRQIGENRQDLLQNNAKVVKDVAQKVTRYCSKAIVIVVTNPLDAMTYLVYKTTGFKPNRIIGMGGILDCARFNMLVARHLNSANSNIQSMIIGAHADSMVILPRLSTVQGTPITELLPQDKIEKIVAETKTFGAKIVKLLGKGSAFYGPSAGVLLLLDSIINAKKDILCASVCVCGQYGLKDLSIGMPVKVGSRGIEEIVELELTEEEKDAFLSSVKQIKGLIKELGV